MEKIKKTFTVTGMTCATCAKAVEKALGKIEGVEFAAVNLATSTGFIVAEKEIPIEMIKTAVEQVGYGISTQPPEKIEKKRYIAAKRNLIFAWFVTLPLALIMLYNMFISPVNYFVWLEIFMGGFVVFYVAKDTIKGAWIALTHKHTNMDTLIFFGSVVSWITSVLEAFGLPVMSFGAIGAMIVAFHITGRFIESHLRDRASKEIKSLLKLQAKEARVITEKGEITVPLEAVKEGLIVSVLPSERIPVDGVVIWGKSSVDESVITGESIPVHKKEDDEVIGGSLNLTGPLRIKVTRVGEDSFLSQMINLVQQAQGSKIPIQALADRITMWFVPTIISLAVIASIVWYFNFEKFVPFLDKMNEIFPWVMSTTEPVNFAIFVFVATIVIACPCALGLATPMALVTGTGLAAKKGLLIKNAEAIQTSKDVKVVLMDKTGTLTEGKPAVVQHNLDETTLKIVASIEKNSNHPLARAISSTVKDFFEVKDIDEIVGEGIRAKVGEDEYFVGKPANPDVYDSFYKEGKTVVEVRKNGDVAGFLAIEDTIRNDSKEAVSRLRNMGIKPVMITGDNETTAKAVANKVGIDEVYSNVKPQDKLDIVRRYQAKGLKVVMIGDGMNDAGALKGADVGIAVGSGTDLAIDSADVIITKGGISKIVDTIEISKRTFKIIKQNLFWAFFYNVIAIPSAMAGLLHPVIAEIAMALSSITVTLNSLRISKGVEI
ncbi:heavy metal translocating P-type ATPase [Pseudothermotoga lettingae]|uniref:P-type Cu(+) transporter n=1 Tax=Pseudothermotoga lettingae (strain ATCC BAA-301 / DSM 14385 / NBRC 107922 / TMO) TaxID=416591 RepID=A8F772_PSELT|nr:heavy metal translocating P-type ATPase [Pseudothermotoga lettingae]ABV34006.1 heavy metal translocating P-type ATPase [Pseudothermotoga lettingae TMO]GLI49055.1 ATPase P [Pseudothermotoga lettingae TMO]